MHNKLIKYLEELLRLEGKVSGKFYHKDFDIYL